MRIVREGWPYLATPAVLGAGAYVAGWPGLAGALVLLGAFMAYFFRDPERRIPQGERLVVSPADGKVVRVVTGAAQTAEGAQLSIFLSVFNVHVNRAPIAGRVAAVAYTKGAFLPAFDEKASLRNEQNRLTIEGGAGTVAFTQIAGILARRIVCWKKAGDVVAAGERVGLIKFGSRVDVFLPAGAELRVAPGERVFGGATVLAVLPEVPRG